MRKTAMLRKLFKEKDLVRIMGAHSGLSAKLAEMAGFDGIWASGLEISTSAAVPDASILTMTDYLQKAVEINDVVNIPVVSDCDTGYGNSSNVIRLIQKYEAAGIAGISIEDKKFPKVNSLFEGRQELASIGEFVGKLIAAKSTQKDPDFMVIARVEALIAGWGMEEALLRAHEYERAGADAILIHHKEPDYSPITEFIERWDGDIPLVLVPSKYPSMTEDEMKSSGKVKLTIYANHGMRSIIPALQKTYTEIYEKGIIGIDSKIAQLSEVFELQGMIELKASEERFSDKSRQKIRCVIPGAGDYSTVKTFEKILRDRPLLLLDIYGKPLIQRAIDSLNDAGIYNISVVVGPHAEQVQLVNVDVIVNPDYKNTFIIDSLMRARHTFDSKTLVVFSDLIFNSTIIQRLINSPYDITLAVDPSITKLTPDQIDTRDPDLVQAELDPVKDIRVLSGDNPNKILRIGKNLPLDETNFEFIGLLSLSKNAIGKFAELYDELKESSQGEFHEAPSFSKASLTDMIQELIERGNVVHAMEVRSGWSEIRTFNDYQLIIQQLANGSSTE